MEGMTVKERLQQAIAEMSDEQAAEMLALAEGVRAGVTPVDIYGTPRGRLLKGVDPEVLRATGEPTIEIPPGIPHVE
jgi:hypothetical protein